MIKDDVEYMKLAMDLAVKAKGQTSPNPMVGAVIVRDGRIVAQGYHRRAGADHAEIIALKKAKALARGATLYLTLEPCCHFGRTPPCVEKIIESGITRVVVGMKDPNPLMDGRSIIRLRKAGLNVKVGVLAVELNKLNEIFIKYIKYKMPFVVCKSAQTIDGKIALSDGRSQWITSQAARDFAHRMRNEFDAIMVGINTVLHDNPFLNATQKNKRIKKIIIDSRLALPIGAHIFEKTRPENVLVATTSRANRSRLKYFKRRGVGVVVCPQKEGRVDLKWLFKELAGMGISSILIEGGAALIGSALKEKLVDKMAIFMASRILGDQQAKSSVDGLRPDDINHLIDLKNIRYQSLGKDLFLEAYIN